MTVEYRVDVSSSRYTGLSYPVYIVQISARDLLSYHLIEHSNCEV